MKSKSTILIIVLLVALFSGCVGGPQATPTPTTQPTTATPSETATTSPSATPLSEVTVSQTPISTPQTTLRESPPIYVATQNIGPVYLEHGNYSLQGVSAYITNEQTNPLYITAQIVSNGQVLYETSFVLDHMGSSYGFTDSEQHYITSTNVTLLLQIQGYQPVEYTFKVAGNRG
jgi:hypothetical protein